ncbi:GNAT family N-acetyltransferase [Achromobacter sp. GG226]|uniref:GNAT family N-acetyltransferase n=1 Tax=Verticiella alkaliphila TaxID=2779529 RepID=UPI001C0BD348|nr:GNAT family N-acetyltransferase [Verticiella sp. GG226]MBU4612919.1 GNAT family N-acetyltransferase [Verticiella sp. GG226]
MNDEREFNAGSIPDQGHGAGAPAAPARWRDAGRPGPVPRLLQVTESLRLRAITPPDAPDVHALVTRNQPRLCHTLHWPRFIRQYSDTVDFCKKAADTFGKSNAVYVMEHDGPLAGVVSFNVLDVPNGCADIGYWIDQRQEKQGLVTASVQALMNAYRAQRLVRRFVIMCATPNQPSRAVAERLGFVREGVLAQAEKIGDEVFDQYVYALTAD